MLPTAVFILGALWGSFCNVCIHRLPNDQNVVTGRSHCPSCKIKINWYDNIPFLSYLLLKGKCRSCKMKISFQYFLVEAIAAFAFLFIFLFFGLTTTTLLFFMLIISFIIIFFIDLKHFIIPNQITYSLMIIGFFKSFVPFLDRSIFPDYFHSLIGGVCGYFIIWLLIFVYKKLKNKEGMGLGDAKLISALGCWFGWISIPFVIFFSSAVALISVIPDLIKKKKKLSSQIPFGPYLIIGCVIFLFFNNQIKLFLN